MAPSRGGRVLRPSPLRVACARTLVTSNAITAGGDPVSPRRDDPASPVELELVV
ncbi:MAG: hypothetical protein H6713_12400 [Myxococcales bacterium]|nr:hypothetical protein [Myxococcales bacterium]MCB9750778.1 hypothetical protein [Myxococcales bacterium]